MPLKRAAQLQDFSNRLYQLIGSRVASVQNEIETYLRTRTDSVLILFAHPPSPPCVLHSCFSSEGLTPKADPLHQISLRSLPIFLPKFWVGHLNGSISDNYQLETKRSWTLLSSRFSLLNIWHSNSHWHRDRLPRFARKAEKPKGAQIGMTDIQLPDEQEVSRRLSVSVNTLRYWRASGDGPNY